MPFSLAGNQPLHGTAKQSAIARNAAITGIIDGGAALYGTGFTIVLTDVNMTTMQITPSITSLLAIALGSLITAGLLTGGDFLPARTRIQDAAIHGHLSAPFCAVQHYNSIYYGI